MTEISQAILRSGFGLAVFATVTAGLIATTHSVTADRITQAQKLAQTKALRDIIPDSYHDNAFLEDAISLPADPLLGNKEEAEAYLSRQNGQVNAVLIPFLAPDGYSGDIRLIAGINTQGELIGVRVLAHQETPGLGDKIESKKSDWIHQFNGKSLTQPEIAQWKVIKDGGQFDQLTGATITPRAVVKSVQKALEYFDKHQAELLMNPRNEHP